MGAILAPLLLLIAIIAIAAYFRRNSLRSDAQLDTPSKLDRPEAVTSASPAVVDLSMLPRQFIVLDLETTGLDPEKHEIIEFGAIRVNVNSNLHQTFQALVKPEKGIPRRITDITGISQSMIDSEGEQLEDVLNQFLEFIQDLPLVTFNADFDMGFLRNAAKKHGLVINNHYTCALKMARRAWPGLPSYRLAELAKLGNLSEKDTHRALGDCERALIVYTSAASALGKAH